MQTLGALYQSLRKTLRESGVTDTPDLDAKLLIAYAFGTAPDDVILKPETPVAENASLRHAVARRLKSEPVSKITGHREFYGLDFTVTQDTLDPRADTETLVDAARRHITPGAHILDLCTGTGCILAALLTLDPAATGIAADVSDSALAVAETNFRKLGLDRRVELVKTDWLESIHGTFHCITCNPPYIETEAVGNLEDNVRLYDPALALDGGPDGLAPYRIVFPQIRHYLHLDGCAVFECGAGQMPDVTRLATEAGLRVIEVARDLGGHERVVVLRV